MIRNSYVKPYHDNSVHLHQFSHAYSNGTYLKSKQEPKNFLYYVGAHPLERSAPICKAPPLLSSSGHRNAFPSRSRAGSVSSVASCANTELPTDSTDCDSTLQLQPGMSEVPAWLKSLRLHKYKQLFADLSYEQMLALTEQQLEMRNVTKGARHKIIVNIEKLKARQSNLANLEKCLHLEGISGIRQALNEIKQVLHTPIKAFSGCKSDGSNAIAEGDLPGQIIHLLEKIQSYLQMESMVDEECIGLYLLCCDKCISHEAFTTLQKQNLIKLRPKIEQIKHVTQQKKWTHQNGEYPNSSPSVQSFSQTAFGGSSSVAIASNPYLNSSTNGQPPMYQKNSTQPHYQASFGGKPTQSTQLSSNMSKGTKSNAIGRDSKVQLLPFVCSNRETASQLYMQSNQQNLTNNDFVRPASVCSDRVVNSSQNSLGACSASMFTDIPSSFGSSGRHTPMSGFSSLEINNRSQRLSLTSDVGARGRVGSESPDLFALSGISSSSSVSSSSGSTSGVELNNNSSMNSISLTNSDMFAVCSQIGMRTCLDQTPQFGVLETNESHLPAMTRLSPFGYETKESIDLFKLKRPSSMFGEIQSENSMNNINIMTGFGRAGTSTRSAYLPDFHSSTDEQADENNQIYSHIELLSLQMTEQALDSSDYS